MKILHISDLHFGPKFIPQVGAATLQTAAACSPQIIVISGDLTQRARPEQFAEARAYIEELKKYCDKVLVVPGNHDAPLYNLFKRFTAPYRDYRHYIGSEKDYQYEDGKSAFFCYNSNAPRLRAKLGSINKAQLKSTESFFKKVSKETFKVVVVHHHLYPLPGFGDKEPMLHAREFLELLTELRVDLVLSGHIHRSYIGNSLDVFSGNDREHGVLLVSSGTTTSRRGRGAEKEKNSLNVINMHNDRIEIDHLMYFSETNTFSSLSTHSYDRRH